jgi:hypothetical protein
MRLIWIVGLAVSLSACDLTIKHEARERLADLLVDPSSAQVRRLVRNDGAICGEVNAKNRMGGYVGFKAFFAPKAGEAKINPEFSPDSKEPVEIYGQFIFDAEFRNACGVDAADLPRG